jgi:hypothetical protein
MVLLLRLCSFNVYAARPTNSIQFKKPQYE